MRWLYRFATQARFLGCKLRVVSQPLFALPLGHSLFVCVLGGDLQASV